MASAFALEALSNEEREVYRVHLAACALCRQLVGGFQSVADILPDALEERQASPGLKNLILAHARAEAGRATGRTSSTADRTRPAWRWPAWMTPARMAIAAALVIVVAGLAAWNIALQLRLDEQQSLAAEQRQILEALAAGALVAQLSGTSAAPNATARLVQSPNGQQAFLLVRNLPRLSSEREYQVWRIAGDVPSGVGTFASTGAGDQIIALSASFAGASAIGVSIEPRGGSSKPTGDIVLLGEF